MTQQLEAVVGELDAKLRTEIDHTTSLPGETLISIVLALPPADRLRCSHVCRRWRHELLDCAAVWTEIDLRLRARPAGALRQIEAWQDRLGGVPLRRAAVTYDETAISAGIFEAMHAAFDPAHLSGLSVRVQSVKHSVHGVANASGVQALHRILPSYVNLASLYVDVDLSVDLLRLLYTLPKLRECTLIPVVGSAPVVLDAAWLEPPPDALLGDMLERLEAPGSRGLSLTLEDKARIVAPRLRHLKTDAWLDLAAELGRSSFLSLETLDLRIGSTILWTVPRIVSHPRVTAAYFRDRGAVSLLPQVAMPALDELVIGGVGLGADMWNDLAVRSPVLRRLVATRIGLTDAHLVGPMRAWGKHLLSVDLSGNDISNAVIEAIAEGGATAGQLESLRVNECARLTSRPILTLAPRVLHADGCSLIEPAAIDWLRAKGSVVRCSFGLSKAEAGRWANRR